MAKSLTLFQAPHPLILESGQQLSPVTQVYSTYGKLNKSKGNAILICHALTGDADVASWWKKVLGPGKAIDTKKYFVICINSIGSCNGSTGPSSINPNTNSPYGSEFPLITIGDMVRAQKALIDQLGIKTLKAVIGGSMGGMQALEWVATYPNMVKACIPIATTAKVTPQTIAFDAVGRQAITEDPNYKDGHYYKGKSSPKQGLAIARMIGHITYLSEESMEKKFGRKLQDKQDYSYDHGIEFQVESYLRYQGDKFSSHFDPNAYIYLTKAISYFDMQKKYGSLKAAFSKSKAKFLVVAISSDWLYTPEQSKTLAKQLMKLNKDVTYVCIDTHYGHDAFLIENQELIQLLSVFLKSV